MAYVPTTEEVKAAWLDWVDPNKVLNGTDSDNALGEFDAWLSQVRRDAVDDAFQVYQAPDHDELDPEPWVVSKNGFETDRRNAHWAPPGSSGIGGPYYCSVFKPRPEYSQVLSDYNPEI